MGKLSSDDIKALIERKQAGESTKDLLKAFNIGKSYFWKLLKDAGIRFPRGRKKHDHQATFAKYMFENPGKVLPRNQKECAKLAGCSVDSVKMYLYRKRKDLLEAAKTVDFCKLPLKLKDVKGRTIPAKAIETYKSSVESWTHVLRLDATLKGGAGFALFRLSEGLVRAIAERYGKAQGAFSPASIQEGTGVPPEAERNADHQLPASANLTES